MLELSDVADIIAEAVKAATEPLLSRIAALEAREIPAAIRGEQGPRGEPGLTGEKGADGRDGVDGKDGAGIADLLQDHEGNLIATFTDGRTKNVGPVRGKDGRDGADGKDMPPFALDDFDITPIDERTIEMSLTHGGAKHNFELKFPVVLDRGVFSDGKAYEAGDAVTWGGSLWIAQRATSSKPDSVDSGWRLAVKRGRDGRDAK